MADATADESQSWGGWIKSMVVGDTAAGFDSLQVANGLKDDHDHAADDSAPAPGSITGLDAVDEGQKRALWSSLASLVGMDVMNMRLSLPIFLFEPTTALTRMAETFEFAGLLDRAAADPDPVMRCAYVAAFVVSAFSHSERARKPFNPVLGETFAFRGPGATGAELSFVAEQVSHHPPLSVSHARGRGWHGGELVDVQATFLGNSLEVRNVGTRYVLLEDTGERFAWNLPTAVAGNLFIGRTFVDHHGEIEITAAGSKYSVLLSLTPCGWFGAGHHEVAGEIVDENDNVVMNLEGAWNEALYGRMEADGAEEVTLWSADDHWLEDHPYAFTAFAERLFKLDEEAEAPVLPSDSRRRGDLRALYSGNTAMAGEEKLRIEQRQRERAEERKSNAAVHSPRFFTLKDKDDNLSWEYADDYWDVVKGLTEEERKSCELF